MSTDQSALLERYHAALTGVFGRPTRVLVRGEGVHVWDADGRRYTDLLAGIAVNALGHGHPALVRAVSEQIATLGHVSNLFTSEPQIRLAERLLELAGAPAGSTVFFANSGTEANEAAFKLARRAQPLWAAKPVKYRAALLERFQHARRQLFKHLARDGRIKRAGESEGKSEGHLCTWYAGTCRQWPKVPSRM